MARADRLVRRAERKRSKEIKGTKGVQFRVTAGEANSIENTDFSGYTAVGDKSKHTVENTGRTTTRRDPKTGKETIIRDESKGIDKRSEITKKTEAKADEFEANERGSAGGEFINDTEAADKENKENIKFNEELRTSGTNNIGTSDNPIQGESFSGESVRKYNAIKTANTILAGADIVLGLAVGGVVAAGVVKGAAAAAAEEATISQILGMTEIPGMTATKATAKAGASILSKITTKTGLNKLLTTKNLIIAGGVSSGASMATWLASDNILTQSTMQANNVVEAVQWGGLDKNTAYQSLEQIEGTANRVTGMLKIFLGINPVAWPFAKAYMINAEVTKRGLDLARGNLDRL